MLKDKPLLYVVTSDDRVYFDFGCLGSETKEIMLKVLNRLFFDKREPPAVSWDGRIYFDLKKWPSPTLEIEGIAQQVLNGPCPGGDNKRAWRMVWENIKDKLQSYFGEDALPLLYITPDDRVFFGLKKRFMDDPKVGRVVLQVLGRFFDKSDSLNFTPDGRGVYVDSEKWPMPEEDKKLMQKDILDKLRFARACLHVHVTSGGRVYVDPEEYLGTPKAQRIIATFNEVLKAP